MRPACIPLEELLTAAICELADDRCALMIELANGPKIFALTVVRHDEQLAGARHEDLAGGIIEIMDRYREWRRDEEGDRRG